MDVYSHVLKHKQEGVSGTRRLAVLLHRLSFAPPPSVKSERRRIKEASKLQNKFLVQREVSQSPGVSAESHLANAPTCVAGIWYDFAASNEASTFANCAVS